MNNRKMTAVFAMLACAVMLSACTNTARGVGRDVVNNGQAAGKAVRGN